MSPWTWSLLALGGVSFARRHLQRRRVHALERALTRDELRAEQVVLDLPPGLQILFRQARTLRAQLGGPLDGLAPPPLTETPWARRERCNRWDLTVVELRRAVWDWRSGFARLDEEERRLLRSGGLGRVPLTFLLVSEIDRTDDPWEQVFFARAPDPGRVAVALRRAIDELQRFEALVLALRVQGYRTPA